VSLEEKAVIPQTCLPQGKSTAHPYRDFIEAGLEKGLSYQRIWQDLVEEYAYCGSYDSVRRYARRIKRSRPELSDVMHAAPGEEAQVDFFSGPLTLDPETGRYFRPHVFRMVLSHSRHACEEAVRAQDLPSFIRCHENAFRFFGGVPRVVRLDNLKAGVARACLYDPEVNPVYQAFASHAGFCPLPCFPGKPEEKGKVEKAGDYLKTNALKGKSFSSLSELNEYLKRWNRNIASLRIHGTTKKQVIAHFLEAEREALKPLPLSPFEHFNYGKRIVHFDGHIRVGNAFYSVPHHLLREEVEVRYTDRILKVYHRGELCAVHAVAHPGTFSTQDEHRPAEKPAKAEGYERHLLSRAQRVGEGAHAWARGAIASRGPRSYRLLQGMLALTRKYPRETVDWACRVAHENSCYHYRTLKRLSEGATEKQETPRLIQECELIRPLSEIGEEVKTIEHRA
jgi:transposase